MHRFITLFLFISLFAGVAMAQQMPDDQVIQYLKEAQAQGKSEKQMTIELMRKGVTTQQLERLKSKYEAAQKETTQTSQKESRSRQRKDNDGDKKNAVKDPRKSNRNTSLNITDNADGMSSEGNNTEENFSNESITENPEDQIFGHNVFTNKNLTFEPNVNMATPQNYRLGPGDEVIIDVWGVSENTIQQTISPEGSILISNIGPVYLNGMTVKEANAYLQREFSKIYSGIGGNTPNSKIKLTLGQIRTIQINIMGEVAVPGTYTMSSFSSVFHALYRAGGVNKIGSLRSIKVVRSGKTIADLDVYDFIMKGKMKDDVRLQEGDVIIVNPYDCLVKIFGKVKRPMFYEMKSGETLALALKYSGGFMGEAYKKAVRVIRKTGREHQVFNVDEMDYSIFKLEDGDVLSVDSVLDRFENRVEIRGAVYRPGLYQVDGNVNTVKLLIKKAEGIRGDAFLNRAVIHRENDDLSREIIPIDLKALLAGTVPDIPLQKNDIVYIPSINDLKEDGTLTIHGEVASPGTYLYAGNMSIEDLVLQAGGLLEAASTARIDVTRRIKNPKSTQLSNVIGKTFSFDFKDGYVVDNGNDFHLEPFDEVYVRRSPAYHTQQNVAISGEVLFAGSYALSKKNERLSDLVTKAGGVTPDAYIKGARLTRKMTEEEFKRKQDALRMSSRKMKDSIVIDSLDMADTYSVGINLPEALANPGSDYDMVLRENDELFIPELISTVKITGSVMYPNTVLYKKGKKLSYYINQAGGYDGMAKKRRAYVVRMNGTVARLKSHKSSLIEPGCEIIIPRKEEKHKMSTAETIAMGTSFASLAAVIATLVNLFK